MTLLIDVNTFSKQELGELVVQLQSRMISMVAEHEMTDIKLQAVLKENEGLRDLLAQRIIGVTIQPVRIATGSGEPKDEEGGETGEEEPQQEPIPIDVKKDKDKFQA